MSLNMLLRYFQIAIYVYFKEVFVKNFMKKLSFLIQIFKIHFRMQYVYYRILGCETL